MKFFIISLQSATKRREFMQIQCENFSKKFAEILDIDFEFINAVPGKDLSEEEISNFYYYDKKEYKKELTKNEMACALSHRLAWEKILQNNIKEAVILEDDTILNNEIFDFLKDIKKLPNNWELILLGHHRAVYSDGFRIESPYSLRYNFNYGKYQLKRLVFMGCCTHAYLINSNGAKKLLNATNKICKPLDFYTWNDKHSNILAVFPPIILAEDHLPFSQRNPDLKSTIFENKSVPKNKFFINKLWRKFKTKIRFFIPSLMPLREF